MQTGAKLKSGGKGTKRPRDEDTPKTYALYHWRHECCMSAACVMCGETVILAQVVEAYFLGLAVGARASTQQMEGAQLKSEAVWRLLCRMCWTDS